MITHASWVIFCKNGTDATTMAMTTARAHTKKRKILVATKAYHGAAPWCTPVLTGVVTEERAHIIAYEYNNAGSLTDAFRAAGWQVPFQALSVTRPHSLPVPIFCKAPG